MKSNTPAKGYSNETSFPFGMHRKIMRGLFFEKNRSFILAGMTLSFFGSIISWWYIWKTLIEKGTMDIILDFYSELGSGSDLISQASSFIFSDISWTTIAVLLASVVLFFTLFLFYASLAFRMATHYKLYKY